MIDIQEQAIRAASAAHAAALTQKRIIYGDKP
jgi:hypothetical protein